MRERTIQERVKNIMEAIPQDDLKPESNDSKELKSMQESLEDIQSDIRHLLFRLEQYTKARRR
jgi:hypothetical protein